MLHTWGIWHPDTSRTVWERNVKETKIRGELQSVFQLWLTVTVTQINSSPVSSYTRCKDVTLPGAVCLEKQFSTIERKTVSIRCAGRGANERNSCWCWWRLCNMESCKWSLSRRNLQFQLVLWDKISRELSRRVKHWWEAEIRFDQFLHHIPVMIPLMTTENL